MMNFCVFIYTSKVEVRSDKTWRN